MYLESKIKEKYRFVRNFAMAHNITEPRVHYWLSKPWETLSYTLRVKIKSMLEKDGIYIQL